MGERDLKIPRQARDDSVFSRDDSVYIREDSAYSLDDSAPSLDDSVLVGWQRLMAGHFAVPPAVNERVKTLPYIQSGFAKLKSFPRFCVDLWDFIALMCKMTNKIL